MFFYHEKKKGFIHLTWIGVAGKRTKCTDRQADRRKKRAQLYNKYQ